VRWASALSAFNQCSKKDDLADSLLQALAFDSYIATNTDSPVRNPAESARCKSRMREEAQGQRMLEQRETSAKKRKRPVGSISKLQTKQDKRAKLVDEKKCGSLPLVR
jgi:hypothetical protein